MSEKVYGFDSEMKQKLEDNIKAIEKEMKGGNSQMPRRDKIEDDFDDDDEDDEDDEEELERPLAAKKEEPKKEEVKPTPQIQQQIIEREITLSLLNDKLNYLISLVQK